MFGYSLAVHPGWKTDDRGFRLSVNQYLPPLPPSSLSQKVKEEVICLREIFDFRNFLLYKFYKFFFTANVYRMQKNTIGDFVFKVGKIEQLKEDRHKNALEACEER